jgi:hypothetical protein
MNASNLSLQDYHTHPIGMRLVSGAFVLLATLFLFLCMMVGLGLCVVLATVLRKRYQSKNADVY